MTIIYFSLTLACLGGTLSLPLGMMICMTNCKERKTLLVGIPALVMLIITYVIASICLLAGANTSVLAFTPAGIGGSLLGSLGGYWFARGKL